MWELVRGNKENAKTLRQKLRQKQRRDLICEEDCLGCSMKRILACVKNCFCKARHLWGCCSQCCTDDKQPTAEDQIEKEKHTGSRYFVSRCILAWSDPRRKTKSKRKNSGSRYFLIRCILARSGYGGPTQSRAAKMKERKTRMKMKT